MSITNLISEELAVPAAGLNALSRAAASYSTGAVDMGAVRQALFIVDSGNASTAGGTINFQLYGCATSGGSYTAISGTSITALTGNSQYALVSIGAEKLSALALGYRFVEGQLTVSGATTVCAVTVLGSDPRFEPANALNVTAVAQILQFFR